MADPKTGEAPYDCGSCKLFPEQRRGVHCGWLPREEWAADYDLEHRPIGPGIWTHDTCPGYLVAQPQIREAMAACEARKAGCLELYFPGLQNPLLDAAALLTSAFARKEAEDLRPKE